MTRIALVHTLDAERFGAANIHSMFMRERMAASGGKRNETLAGGVAALRAGIEDESAVT